MSNGIRIAVDSGHGMQTAAKRTPPLPEDLYINGVLVKRKGEQIHEKEFNKPTAEYLIEALNRCGFLTCNTSPGTEDVSLSARVRTANEFGAHCFVSKHFNALTLDYWRDKTYTVVFRWANGKPESERLGNLMADAISSVHNLPNSGCGTDRAYMGIELYVLKYSNANVAVLSESGFMDVYSDAKRMLDPAFQMADAEATCKAICTYYGVPYVEPTGSNSSVSWVGLVASNTGVIDVREQPYAESTLRGNFWNGEHMVVTTEHGGWGFAQGCRDGGSFSGWVDISKLQKVDLNTKPLLTTNTPDGIVNIRSGPTSRVSNIIGTMGVEDDFRILEEYPSTSYALIFYSKGNTHMIGYADKYYMFNHYVCKVVNTDYLNCRSTPDSSSASNIVRVLGKGNLVEVYNPVQGADNQTWYRVGSSGTVFGYVNYKYIERI